jgi:peptidoglycan/LPS O-acetylase OafA/YrhL
MMITSDPLPVTLSQAVYAMLLRVYPRAFQQEFKEETARVFRDDCRATYAGGGRLALLALWLRALPDVIRCAAGEHFTEWMSDHPAQRRSTRHQALLALALALGVVAVFLVDQNTPPETPMAIMYACVLFAAGALLPPRRAALIGAATLGVYVVDGWISPSGWTGYRALGLVALLAAGVWALRTGADHARLRAMLESRHGRTP